MKIILDTDIGDDVDDAFALLLAINTPRLEILGVTTAYRNAPLRAKIAAHLIRSAGKTVPVYAGASYPLRQDILRFDYEKIGADGLPIIRQYYDYMSDERVETKPAAEFIRECADEYPGEVTLVSIGPLTNAATALDRYPESFAKLGRLVIMGGELAAKQAEWNLRLDAFAAPQGYISQFRFGCALCDVASSYVALYEIFDTVITDGADEDGNLDYNECGVRIIKSLGNASELKPQNDVFWGGYSYESGAEAAARRAHDKSVTEISVLPTDEIRTVEYREKWIGDVKILESFDNISADGEITEENAGYIRTGAPATLYAAPFDGGYSLGVKVGDYATEFDGAKFVNVTIPAVNANWRDWSGANGFTMRVKNNGDKFVNMNVEFFGVEPSGAQFRWCMSFIGSRVYALDTNTGEEWSFISGSRLYIPPAFNGWIRIPFTQFRPNGGVAPFSNVLNLDYPVAGLYLTSSIVDNSGAELVFDDIGLYYGDFGAASAFENTVTIRDLLNAHDYKEKYL